MLRVFFSDRDACSPSKQACQVAAIDEVIARVEEKNSGENLFRNAVRDGMAPSEAFAKFGVL